MLLYYILKCFTGISTTEKNRISTREKLRLFWMQTRRGRIILLFNYYRDWCLKVASAEIDAEFPNGFGITIEYKIPNHCTNRKQRALPDGAMSGTQVISWILYADDICLFSQSATARLQETPRDPTSLIYTIWPDLIIQKDKNAVLKTPGLGKGGIFIQRRRHAD